MHHAFYCKCTKDHRAKTKELIQQLPDFEERERLLLHLIPSGPPPRTLALTLELEADIRAMVGAVHWTAFIAPEDQTDGPLQIFQRIIGVWMQAWDMYKSILYEGIKSRPPQLDEDEQAMQEAEDQEQDD